MCANADLKISLHVCVRKIAIYSENFTFLMNSSVIYRRSFIFPRKVGSILCFSYSYANILTAFWFLICAYLKKWGWTFCSLLITFWSLLFARCSLLFARLLVARWSLLVTFRSLLLTFYSLLVVRYFLLVPRYFLLVARRSLLFARCLLLVTFCSFARCLLWNKITVSREKMVWLLRNSTTNIFVANLWDFRNFFWMVIFKVFSTCKTIFKVGIKSQILDITMMSLLQYLDTILTTFMYLKSQK